MNRLALLAPALALSAGLCAPASAANLPGFVAKPVEKIFQKLAAAKHDRVFHADGTAFHATVRDGAGAEHDAIVRISRGGANKVNKPDILGLAIKVKTAKGDQDVLMVTALGRKGAGARVPAFRESLAGQKMSTITSYRNGDYKGAITTQLPASFHTVIDSTPTRATGDQSFKLTMRQGHLFRAATEQTVEENVTVHFDKPLTPAENATLKFTPFNDAAGIRPVGIVNASRKEAYVGSQEGRGVTK